MVASDEQMKQGSLPSVPCSLARPREMRKHAPWRLHLTPPRAPVPRWPAHVCPAPLPWVGDSDVESVSSQGEAAADAADLSSTEKSEDDGDHLVAMKMHTDAGPRAPIRAVEQVEEHVVEDEDEDDAAIIAALQREPSRPLSAPPSGMDLQQSSNPAAGRAPMLGGDWDE